MANYLTNFNTREDYSMFKYGDMPNTNVSYIQSEDVVEYNKQTVEAQPFTITCVHDNSNIRYLNFHTHRAATSADAEKLYFKYSIDDGVTWTTLLTGNQLANEYENKEVNTGIGLLEGDSVQIIANTGGCMIYDLFFDTNDSDCEFKLSGNVLSLYSGDAYISGETDTKEISSNDMPEYDLGENTISYFRLNHLTPGSNATVYDISDLWLPTYSLNRFMYYRAFVDSGIKNVPDVQFNVSSLPYNCFYQMFNGCNSLTDGSDFKIKLMTPVVIYGGGAMSYMFGDCENLVTGATIDINNLNEITFTPAENNMYFGETDNDVLRGVYSACYNLTDTGINIPTVTICGYSNSAFINTFAGCHQIQSCGINEIKRLNQYESEQIKYGSERNVPSIYNLLNYAFNDCFTLPATPKVTGVFEGDLTGMEYAFNGMQSCTAIYWLANRFRTAENMTGGLQNHDGTFYVDMQLKFDPMNYRENGNGIPENWDIKIKAGNYHIYTWSNYERGWEDIVVDGVNYAHYIGGCYVKYNGHGLGLYWYLLANELIINGTTYDNITWTYKEDRDGHGLYESNITFNGHPIYGMMNNTDNNMNIYVNYDGLDTPSIKLDLDYTYTLANDIVIYDHNA